LQDAMNTAESKTAAAPRKANAFRVKMFFEVFIKPSFKLFSQRETGSPAERRTVAIVCWHCKHLPPVSNSV